MQINAIFVFIVALVVFYHIVAMQKDANASSSYKVFMLMVILAILGYYLWQYKEVETNTSIKSDKFFDDLEKQIHTTFSNNTVFLVHRSTRNIKYIRKQLHVALFIKDLDFLNVYQKEAYHKLIIYLEHFLKIHFNIMIDKYDCRSFLPMLRDMRVIILNIMSSLTFSLPYISTIIDTNVKTMDEFIAEKTRDIDAILYNYIKIAAHKNKEINKHEHIAYKYPTENDPYTDSHEMFV